MFGRRKKNKKTSILEKVKKDVERNYTKNIQMPDNIITTSLDTLLDLIIKKGRIQLKDAAKVFSVTRAQIEEWAKILEEHDLIEIHYPPLGEPELRKKQPPKEKKG